MVPFLPTAANFRPKSSNFENLVVVVGGVFWLGTLKTSS